MTTKVNKLSLGTGVAIKPRIVIEFDPVQGGSILKTYGPLTIPIVIDCLMAQLQSLWRQWIASMTSQIKDANGQAIVTPQNTPMLESQPEGEGEPS